MNKKILIILTFGILLSERGDLISYEYKEFKLVNDIQTELDSEVGELGPNAIYDIELYSIVYETIDQFGETTQASGSIAIPYDDNFAYPFYLFGHGTQIRRSSAPSMNGFSLLNMWVATSGYIYIEADYLGLGVSEILHPYHLKDVTASTMIDMIYASREFCRQLGSIQYNNQLFIAGYSEGGYATMATVKEIEENYNDINITMSFPMAGAYDLSGTMVDLMLLEEPYADPFYLPFFILSYIEKYNLGALDIFFKSDYIEGLPEWFSGEYSGGYINEFLPDIPIHMMLPEMVEEFDNNPNFPFRLYLEENNLINWVPQNPMYMFHGILDERVPHQNSIVAFETFENNGSTSVYFESLDESYGGHQDAAPWCLITAFNISEDVKNICLIGDTNIDGSINVVDIIYLIDLIIEEISTNYTNICQPDVNNDSILNIFDIMLLIERILNE